MFLLVDPAQQAVLCSYIVRSFISLWRIWTRLGEIDLRDVLVVLRLFRLCSIYESSPRGNDCIDHSKSLVLPKEGGSLLSEPAPSPPSFGGGVYLILQSEQFRVKRSRLFGIVISHGTNIDLLQAILVIIGADKRRSVKKAYDVTLMSSEQVMSTMTGAFDGNVLQKCGRS